MVTGCEVGYADLHQVWPGGCVQYLNKVCGKLGVRGAIPAVLEAVRRGIITL